MSGGTSDRGRRRPGATPLALFVAAVLASSCSSSNPTPSVSQMPVASPSGASAASSASLAPATPGESAAASQGSAASPTPAPSPTAKPGLYPAGTLHLAHEGPAVVALRDGRALVVGNRVFDSYRGAPPDVSTTITEVWDPASGKWKVVTPLPKPRDLATVVGLQDGRVMVIGGMNASGASYSSCYIFNPETNGWDKTGVLETARYDAGAAVLEDGRVLVVGGRYSTGLGNYGATGEVTLAAYNPLADVDPGPPGHPLALAEVYDPRTESWTTTGSMRMVRDRPGVVRLSDGRVLVWGGQEDGNEGIELRAELYDPATGHFNLAARDPVPSDSRIAALGIAGNYSGWRSWAAPTLTATPNGDVFLIGGIWWSGDIRVQTSFRYDALADSWVEVGELYVERDDESGGSVIARWGTKRPTVVVASLRDGTFVVSGGSEWRRLERFDPGQGTWTRLSNPPTAIADASGEQLADGSLLLVPAGGRYTDAYRLVLDP